MTKEPNPNQIPSSDEMERSAYLEGVKADYAALARDPSDLEEFQQELAIWDSTINDGLEKL